jgi:hypothetical protein
MPPVPGRGGYPELAVLIGGGPPIICVGGVPPTMGLAVRPTAAGLGAKLFV